MSGLTVAKLSRVFQYNGMQLNDPGESLAPDDVRDLYSETYPELSTATVEGPVYEGDKAMYSFIRAVRDKG